MRPYLIKRLYFAHPINTYGTALERDMLELITKKFPAHIIVNPAAQIHKDAVGALRKDDPTINVMPYFRTLTASCQTLVALPFGDGMWGAGVWYEAEIVWNKSGFVWMIHPNTHTITFASKLPERDKLSVEDTRLRIRNADGTTKPYA